MVYFQIKNPNLGKFCWALDWKMFYLFYAPSEYFTVLINLCPFGIFYGHSGYFMTIWYILCPFGTYFPVLVSSIVKNLATLRGTKIHERNPALPGRHLDLATADVHLARPLGPVDVGRRLDLGHSSPVAPARIAWTQAALFLHPLFLLQKIIRGRFQKPVVTLPRRKFRGPFLTSPLAPRG
jgi:hypothetical protein